MTLLDIKLKLDIKLDIISLIRKFTCPSNKKVARPDLLFIFCVC